MAGGNARALDCLRHGGSGRHAQDRSVLFEGQGIYHLDLNFSAAHFPYN
jgi:hypothetical protein